MTSSNRTPHFYQDIASYRPRHANIGIDFVGQLTLPQSLPQRPKNFNTFGRECGITLNTFNVIKTPNTIVHQYDLNFTGDATDYTKRALLKKIFYSKGVKAALGEPKNLWVWDGNKLAW
jgi:eukaryotic translation initiation factor 2C